MDSRAKTSVFFPLFRDERAGEAATRDASDVRRRAAEGTIISLTKGREKGKSVCVRGKMVDGGKKDGPVEK